MFELWMTLAIETRLALLAIVGLIGGALANHAIYTWCYFPRPISPWAAKATTTATTTAAATGDMPLRTWADRMPVLGWWRLSRESSLHGRGFWLRPMLIELGLALAVPGLYWFETQLGGLFPLIGRPANIVQTLGPSLHACFFAHMLLLFLMTAATFIDFDERTVPDVITIPGTLLALILAGCFPQIFMVGELFAGPGGVAGAGAGEFLPTMFHLPTSATMPAAWQGTQGLVAGLAIWTTWCFALSNRRVILRRGLSKAVQYFFASLVRGYPWKVLLVIWGVGLAGVTLAWTQSGPPGNAQGGLAGIMTTWNGVFTSLVGLAVGGGIVWSIRIIGWLTLGKEAMGFGDVTLMAMIGAFIGWQASLSAFFLSPFAAIGIVIVMFILTRDPATPFGPYLCAGTVGTIVMWDALYNGSIAAMLFMWGPQLKWLALTLLVLMAAMLGVIRVVKLALGIDR